MDSESTSPPSTPQTPVPSFPPPEAPQSSVSLLGRDRDGDRDESESESSEFSVQNEVSDIPSSCEEFLSAEQKRRSAIYKAFYTAADHLQKRVVIFALVLLLIFVVFVLCFAGSAIYYSTARTRLCYGSTDVDMMETGQGGLYIKNFVQPSFVEEERDGRTVYVAEYDGLSIVGDSPHADTFRISYEPETPPNCTVPTEDGGEYRTLENCYCGRLEDSEALYISCYQAASEFRLVDSQCTSVFIQVDLTLGSADDSLDGSPAILAKNVTWKALCGTKSPCGSIIRYYTSVGFVPTEEEEEEETDGLSGYNASQRDVTGKAGDAEAMMESL